MNPSKSTMNQKQKSVLERLFSKYYSSKAYTNDSKKAKPAISDKELDHLLGSKTSLFDRYNTETGSPEFTDQVNQMLEELEEKDYVRLKKEKGASIYSKVYLNIERVEDISKEIGMKTKEKTEEEILSILKQYEGIPFFEPFIKEQYEAIKNHKMVKYSQTNGQLNLKRFENILKAVNAIISQKEEIYIRVLSSQLFKDSKYLESILKTVCNFILLYSEDDFQYLEHEIDILPSFNVYKNPGYVYFKGTGMITFKNGAAYKLFGNTIGILSTELKKIETIKIENETVITIENLTTFHGENENAFYVYLAGYHNSTRCDFLRQLFKDNPDKVYYHFGDIDSGGFYIFNRLKRETNIPFIPYKMSVKDLKEKKEYWKTLKDTDVKRLKMILKNEGMKIFHPVTEYMLKNNCKLEQESFQI